MDKIIEDKYELIIKPSKGLFKLNIKELWEYRELLYFLIWRDVKIKYKQSLLGVGWAVFQPIMSMVVFSLIFGKIAKMPSGGVPYPVFTLCGVVIWNYFSQSVTDGTNSLIDNRHLITKVYFPRLIIPLAMVGKGLFDFLIALIILFLIIIYYQINPCINFIFFPVFVVLSFVSSISICLWTSAISVKYRDIPKTIPFLIRMLFWLTPVAYGTVVIPERYLFIYTLNPIYSIIEGFRWSLINTSFPKIEVMIVSFFMMLLFFITGLFYFKKVEKQFADLI